MNKMIGLKKVTVEYPLMSKPPLFWDTSVGAKVVEKIIRQLHPYIIDRDDVKDIIFKLPKEVNLVIGDYQAQKGVIITTENNEAKEFKTVGLLADLYKRISTLEKENEELRLLIANDKT